MKKIILLIIISIFSKEHITSQPWAFDFGNSTSSSHSSGVSTSFLPTPISGTSRVRVGTGGGSFNLDNSGLPNLGIDAELRIEAPTNSSVNKFSLYGYTASTTFYTKFNILVGDNTGSSSATSGEFYFFQGSGASYSDNNSFSGSQVFTGLKFVYGSSGSITFTYRGGSSWISTGISGTPFNQGNIYSVEIYGNNGTSTVNYTGGTIATDKFDLWVNGSLIGDDLSKAQLANNTNIDAFMFYGISSASNAANLFIDDIEYSNSIPTCGTSKLLPSSMTNMIEQCTDGNSWTYYGTGTNSYFAINKNGNTFNATVDITVSGTPYTSTSSNGVNQENASYLMGRYWNVTLSSGSISSPVSVRFYYDPADTTSTKIARDNAYTTLTGSNPSTLAVKNAAMEWFKTTGVPFSPSNWVGNKLTSPFIKLSGVYGSQNSIDYVEFSGITSFSGGTGGFSFGSANGGGSNGLPITWAGITVQTRTNSNEILWQTSSEERTAYFEVESSEDGKHFQIISPQLSAAGFSQEFKSYSFEDKNPLTTTFYRVKQVDVEGSFDYSKIVLAKRNSEHIFNLDFNIHTDNNEFINIEIQNSLYETSTVSIADISGRIVYQMNTNEVLIPIKTSFLKSGLYFISVQNGGERIVKKNHIVI